MTAGPFLTELLRRLRYQDPQAALTAAGDGVTWQADPGAVVTLITSEDELAQAVRVTGLDVRDDLWPDSTIEAAGFNLILVHLDEVLATRDVTEPLRLTGEGLVWPGSRPPTVEDQPDPGGGPYYWSAAGPDGKRYPPESA